MTSRHGVDKNELLIERLKPWLKSTAWAEDVPPADIADVVAEARAKAISVLREMERGERRRLPSRELEPYIKVVMRNAIRDWKRFHPKAAEVSPGERALVDSELFSIDKDEGGGGFSALPTIRVPVDSSAPTQPRRHPLVTLVQYRFWRKPGPSEEYERIQKLLNDIPKDNRREAVLLDLQGYRQGQIALRLLVTQPYVSKVLREQYAAWGWNDEKVQVTRAVMAYASLIRLFGRVFPRGGVVFPRPRSQPFQWIDFRQEEWESEEERRGFLQVMRKAYNIHGRSFELPRDDKAYNRSRRPTYLEDLGLSIEEESEQCQTSEENGVVDHSSEGPQPGRKERGQRKLNRLKAQETRLYQAIMNEPTLARWTKDLKRYHMGQLISRVVGDGDYYDDDFLRL